MNVTNKLVIANCNSMVYNPALGMLDSIGQKKTTRTRLGNDLLCYLSFDINFLNTCVNMEHGAPVVVYLCYLPSDHIKRLVKMYEFIDFHFFDEMEIPQDFSAFESGNDNCHFYDHLPEDDEIEALKELPNVYLISNYVDLEIRTMEEATTDKERSANHARKEQLNVHCSDVNMSYATRINPKCAMLYFRPPHYHDGDTSKKTEFEFFNGTILLSLFSGIKSSESRMICTNYEVRIPWNYKILSHAINKWNYETRETLALNPFTGTKISLPNQLGNQMEISIFFAILRDYFTCIGHENASATDVYAMYSQFIIGKYDNDTCK